MFPVLIALVAPALAETPTHEGGQLRAGPLAFAPSTATLTPESAPTIEAVAGWLAANPDVPLRVEVHTDSRGSGAYNLKVSQDRADAIVAALVAAGVAADRVVAQGWGETKPLVSNDTAAGRDQNRRIELWTTPTTESPPKPEPPPTATAAASASPAAPARDALCVTLDQAIAQARQGDAWSRPYPGDAPEALVARVEACLPGWTEVERGRTGSFLLLQGASGVQVQVGEVQETTTVYVTGPR